MTESEIHRFRYFLKDSIRRAVDFRQTAQNRGMPPPPPEKEPAAGQEILNLTDPREFTDRFTIPLARAIAMRESVRRYTGDPLSITELSFLLWAAQGLRMPGTPHHYFRTVPSAGARHALETYLYAGNVTGLAEGIYRYLPLSHRLVCEYRKSGLAGAVTAGCLGQRFAGDSAATFIWAALPVRMEWRYGLAAHKVIAIEAGHVCQNLYLACQAMGAGTCAIAAYDQERMDALIGADGEEEFVIYIAPVGKV